MAKKFQGERFLGADMGKRVLFAYLLYVQQQDRPVPLAEFGEIVAKVEGKERPYSASSVSRWTTGTPDGSEISPLTALALSHLVGGPSVLDPGWLMFGAGSNAKAPAGVDRTFTLADLAAARGRRGRRTGS
ncbi:MAG: hypothetical protein JWL95_2822 [Gemmatimonadetes bacterium]|nr:hypothetical protein [Gemmatimonadota bacterium]